MPRKREAARLARDAGLPLTLNAVVHRRNLNRLPEMIALALDLGAARLEVAHVPYYRLALANRDALPPTREQLDAATATVEAARSAQNGRLVIDDVIPDDYAARPKSSMGGWGRQVMAISPAGRALPCHAAESLPGFEFPNVHDGSLRDTWFESEPVQRYRGTGRMQEPCRSCDRRESDWGGCRCQGFALTGDPAATDPACALSAPHALLDLAVQDTAMATDRPISREKGRAPTR